ncbi:hypothetical protein ACOCEA_09045 [Maribacter sp. CXY002]|uniref:hypothetical protein n=1 Tax=Maribacter luteocoastalis TaxID=3407671 RepID=UPI003B672696
MKKGISIWVCIALSTLAFTNAFGQTDNKKKEAIIKRTLMDKFEPEYVLSIDERAALKDKRLVQEQRTKRILDTLSISDRKRRKLIRELKKSPFSKRINEAIMANSEFEDIEEEDRP